jgi:nucleotide-binding universal stress UspA family protein
MSEFQKLFVAIDFSPGSDEALRQAHQRAKSTSARLAVCHIIPNELRNNLLFPHISRITALRFPLETKRIAEAASARVSEITGRKDGEYELIIDDGTPQALILTRAEEWFADLIIVGSHGQTSAADTLLGSVSDSIIRHAHCPVLIARPGKQTGRILAGTDFSDPALPALRAAAAETRRVGAIDVGVFTRTPLGLAGLTFSMDLRGSTRFRLSSEVSGITPEYHRPTCRLSA